MTALLRLTLRDVVFAHWRVDPVAVARLLPAGLQPDTHEGGAYVGLVGVTMWHVRPTGLPPVPHLSTFPQVNVRLYARSSDGRSGVVFCSMDAPRLATSLAGLLGTLPYRRSRVRRRLEGDVVGYDVARRGTSPTGRGSLVVRTGPRKPRPSRLERFLTGPPGLFTVVRRTAWFLPLRHPTWQLHRASVVDVDPGLVRDAGIEVEGSPVSLLWSPGVDASFDRPSAVRG